MARFELMCEYDVRQSFYHKAIVEEDKDGLKTLYSYETPVATIDRKGKYTELDYCPHSMTTNRHVKEFRKQFEAR